MASHARKAALVILLLAAGQAAHAQSAAPCGDPEFRRFDFWIGDWQVARPDGAFAGMNRISAEYDGCVIHERYATGRGYSGESLNAWDAGRKLWHQTWVDNQGTLLALEGGWNGSAMVLAGETRDAKGATTRHRITWTPNADGSVRQLWESTDVKGDWTIAFDGRYTKRAPK